MGSWCKWHFCDWGIQKPSQVGWMVPCHWERPSREGWWVAVALWRQGGTYLERRRAGEGREERKRRGREAHRKVDERKQRLCFESRGWRCRWCWVGGRLCDPTDLILRPNLSLISWYYPVIMFLSNFWLIQLPVSILGWIYNSGAASAP